MDNRFRFDEAHLCVAEDSPGMLELNESTAALLAGARSTPCSTAVMQCVVQPL